MSQWVGTPTRAKSGQRRAVWRMGAPMVYFIGCNEFVKIGTTTDPSIRLSSMQSCSPYDLAMRALMYGGEEQEGLLHIFFRALRVRGEWFRFEPPLSTLVLAIEDMEPEQAGVVTKEHVPYFRPATVRKTPKPEDV